MCFFKQYSIIALLFSILPCLASQELRNQRIDKLVQLLPSFNTFEKQPVYKKSDSEEFSRALEWNTRLFEIFLQEKEWGNCDDTIPQERIGCLEIQNWTELCAIMSMFVSKKDQNDVTIQTAPYLMHLYKKMGQIEKEKKEELENLIAVHQEALYTQAVIDFLIPLEHVPDNFITDPAHENAREPRRKRKNSNSGPPRAPRKKQAKKKKKTKTEDN